MISAKIVADSKNQFGNRLTTFVLTMPRIVLAEFNTHRMISRNSASSRAIPFEKMVKMVQETPFVPLKFMREHKGMQGTEFFEDHEDKHDLKIQWLQARTNAVAQAVKLSEIGLTKQMCNRLLEPFMYHTVIATSSEWQNFFALRAQDAAEIHIQDLAYKMLEEYNKSEPKLLKSSEWHVPFGNNIDESRLLQFQNVIIGEDITRVPDVQDIAIKIATARCARVSYTIIGEEGKPDNYENDIKLHDRLASMGHWSPFEHCAKVMDKWEYESVGIDDLVDEKLQGWSGNFRGFIQYRKMFENENKSDNRVIIK